MNTEREMNVALPPEGHEPVVDSPETADTYEALQKLEDDEEKLFVALEKHLEALPDDAAREQFLREYYDTHLPHDQIDITTAPASSDDPTHVEPPATPSSSA